MLELSGELGGQLVKVLSNVRDPGSRYSDRGARMDRSHQGLS